MAGESLPEHALDTCYVLSAYSVAMGDHLRQARERLGLTQAQVAKAIGRDQPAISRYERGARPDLSIVPAYAKALELSEIEVLFGPAASAPNSEAA